MGTQRQILKFNEKCPHKRNCIPGSRGASEDYCHECRACGFLYYFPKDEYLKDEEMHSGKDEHLAGSFIERPYQKSIRCSSGVMFGWSKGKKNG